MSRLCFYDPSNLQAVEGSKTAFTLFVSFFYVIIFMCKLNFH